MAITLKYQVTSVNANTGTYTVRYWAEENPEFVLNYQYAIPLDEAGKPVNADMFIEYILNRAPTQDLEIQASAVKMDVSHLQGLVVPETDTPAEESPTLTFGELQAQLIAEVDIIARNLRNSLMQEYSPYEAASWPIKYAEAVAYNAVLVEGKTVADASVIAPSILKEATDRGVDVAWLVEKILSKADRFIKLETMISGYAGKLIDQLKAVPNGDMEALLAIDIESEWAIS